MSNTKSIQWPGKCDLFGAGITPTCYAEAEELILSAAEQRESAIVTALPVHGVVTAAHDREYREKISSFELVVPDGQPVRWSLNCFYATKLRDRVYGPELMLRLCARAAEMGIGIYLYGSRPEVIERLKRNLERRWPTLRIVGDESPPFRPLDEEETDQLGQRINTSGAGMVFVGLGLPKQDFFAYEMRRRIRAVLVCVGAAFDLHAGMRKMAPRWMQRCGLEWLFRLAQEPRRLWKRYLPTNAAFLLLVLQRLLGREKKIAPVPISVE